jgi:DNA-binding NtrC family response regulator
VDVRLICATNRSLSDMCRANEFRPDLLYRVNTVEVRVPPLRERVEDIEALFEHFASIYARKYNLAPKPLSPAALQRLQTHGWPGNIRELRHAIERALIMSDAPVLDSKDFFLTDEMSASAPTAQSSSYNLEDVEQEVIRRVLEKHAGNVTHAARELGITRTSLYRRMERYGL